MVNGGSEVSEDLPRNVGGVDADGIRGAKPKAQSKGSKGKRRLVLGSTCPTDEYGRTVNGDSAGGVTKDLPRKSVKTSAGDQHKVGKPKAQSHPSRRSV